MSVKLAVCLAVILAVCALNAFADEIDAGLRDRKLVESTIACIEGKATCTRFGSKAKVVVTELAQKGKCTSCSKEEEDKAFEIIKRFKTMYPTEYQRLFQKFKETVKNS